MTMKIPSDPPVAAGAGSSPPEPMAVMHAARIPKLDELLAQIDPERVLSAEDKAWLDAPSVGNELL